MEILVVTAFFVVLFLIARISILHQRVKEMKKTLTDLKSELNKLPGNDSK